MGLWSMHWGLGSSTYIGFCLLSSPFPWLGAKPPIPLTPASDFCCLLFPAWLRHGCGENTCEGLHLPHRYPHSQGSRTLNSNKNHHDSLRDYRRIVKAFPLLLNKGPIFSLFTESCKLCSWPSPQAFINIFFARLRN